MKEHSRTEPHAADMEVSCDSAASPFAVEHDLRPSATAGEALFSSRANAAHWAPALGAARLNFVLEDCIEGLEDGLAYH